jgi:hypothetical protein
MKGCGELWEGEQWCGATIFSLHNLVFFIISSINIDRKYVSIKDGLEIPFTIYHWYVSQIYNSLTSFNGYQKTLSL